MISCESPAVVQLGDDEPLRKPGPYRGLGVVKPVWGLKGDGVALNEVAGSSMRAKHVKIRSQLRWPPISGATCLLDLVFSLYLHFC